jgi:hypothetical protein
MGFFKKLKKRVKKVAKQSVKAVSSVAKAPVNAAKSLAKGTVGAASALSKGKPLAAGKSLVRGTVNAGRSYVKGAAQGLKHATKAGVGAATLGTRSAFDVASKVPGVGRATDSVRKTGSALAGRAESDTNKFNAGLRKNLAGIAYHKEEDEE